MPNFDEKLLIREGLELLFNQSFQEFNAAVTSRDAAAAALASSEKRVQETQGRVNHLAAMLDVDYRTLPKTGIVPGAAMLPKPSNSWVGGRVLRRRRVPLNDTAPEMQARRPNEWKNDVVARLMILLDSGERSTAMNLYAALEAEGVSFQGIENPAHRLVQIMSADPRFDSNRVEGWGLKKENPAGTGFPATTSASDLD